MTIDVLQNNLNESVSYQEYFSALGYDKKDIIFLRRFNDQDNDAPGHNYEVSLGNFEAIIPELKKANSEKNGIFYVVNGGGQKKDNVVTCRAQFIDPDDFSLEEQMRRLNEFPLEPSIIVKTKRSLHSYWLIKDGDIQRFEEIQARLIQHFQSDPVIKDKSRVMRLYGFYHMKNDPVMVTLIKFNPELKYTQEALHDVLPLLKRKKTSPKVKKSEELIPHGSRHYYVMQRIGEFVSKLGKTTDDETILELVEADFLKNCEAIPSDDMADFRRKYLRAIVQCRSSFEAEQKDPDFYKYALKAWKAENPGKEFDTETTTWDDVAEAGRRAKAVNKRFDYVSNSKDEECEQEHLICREYSDVSQAKLFVSEYGGIVRFSKATGFLKYSGRVWEESELKAQRLSQELTDRQLKEVRKMLQNARRVKDREAESITPNTGEVVRAEAAIEEAESLRKMIVKRRTSQRISATLAEASPWIEIDVKALDANGYLLNTPGGTVDLRTGNIRANDPNDYCTKITAIAPDNKNADLFVEFLDQVTCGDSDLKRYLQEVAGVFAVGIVKREELYIATGCGGNGKSTFFNLLFKALGDYSGMISSDVLTKNSRTNKGYELAELRGKRMILAAELDEGKVLDSAMLKKMASMDPIQAERKYKDPFFFIPSHSVVLYTNHLPIVGARDSGTWDRIVVLPFNARFRNTQNEVKDYASVLFDKCGGYVLSWMIEGAQRYISNNFFIDAPDCVKKAVEQYRAENDWLREFLKARCCLDRAGVVMAGELYKEYREYCIEMGEFARHQSEFKKALETIGVQSKKTAPGVVYKGIRIKDYVDRNKELADAKKEAFIDKDAG